MHHLPSLELFIRNFLVTCLEVERRFSLKNGFLVKLIKNGELSSPNKKTSFRFVPNRHICSAYLCLLTHADVKRTANVEPYYSPRYKFRTVSKPNETEKKNYTNKYILKLIFVTIKMFSKNVEKIIKPK